MRLTCRVPLRIDFAGGWSDIPPCATTIGGAVLNAAITRYVTGELVVRGADEHGTIERGMRISYSMDLPTGNGLGSSAALSVAWLALVRANMGEQDLPADLASMACDLGALLGIMGGKQDEYGAALGGFNLLRFSHNVEVERIAVPAAILAELEARLILIYSGQSRLSGDIHDHVWGALQRGNERVARTLGVLRDTALQMRVSLGAGDIGAFGRLMDENWQAQRALHASITNPAVDALCDAARGAGAQAGKACGAGGGGCLVFLAPVGHVNAVRQALSAAGGEVIPFGFDHRGVQIERHDD